MPVPTLLDIAKHVGNDALVGLIEEAAIPCPEITGVDPWTGARIGNMGAARTIPGLNYKTLVRTGLPTVGFRNANEGATPSLSTYENRLVETYILNPQWEADKAVADRHPDGWQAYLALEGVGMMMAALIALARQFYYGGNTNGDAKGHPGLIDAVSSDLTVDATGTGGTTSSVWGVKFGPRDVQWVYGNDGSLELSDVSTVRLQDAALKPYTGYRQEILAYPGLQVGSIYSCGRVKNVGTASGKTLEDDMIIDLLSKFKAGQRPDVLLMSRRSRKQLQQSRTAVNATGAPAPMPTEVEGVPIVATDAILDTETAS